jgi:hypothetical protein
LADIGMPGLNGYELCAAIRRDPSLAHIPVLLLTGTFETYDEPKAREVGASGHIAKPFEAQALVDRVFQLLAQAKPKSVLLVPVCTVQGVTHYVELPSGDAPVERKAASQHDHCSFCGSGGERAALPSGFSGFQVQSFSSFSFPKLEVPFEQQKKSFTANPRAPPFLPNVHVNNEHFGRTHEELSAVGPRGARAGLRDVRGREGSRVRSRVPRGGGLGV